MLLIRKSLSRALLLQKRQFSTQVNPQEIISNTSLAFNPTLDAIERLDAKFQTGKSINSDIIGDKDQLLKVKHIYLQLFKALTGNIKLDELKGQIEPRLLTELDENITYLKDNDLKIGILGSSLYARNEAETLKKLDVSHIGYLKVLEANIERNKNLFIHEYNIERSDDRLLYVPKEDPAFKEMPTSRKQKMQQDMVEALKEKKENKPVKDAVMWTAKKLGFMTPDELKQPPKFLVNLVNFKDRLYGSVEGEDHILVEDYEILSPLGLYIQNIKTKEIIKSEGKEGESFRHFVRVERLYENRDAPSVKKAKPILLVDFDFILRGNPHSLVKNFAGC